MVLDQFRQHFLRQFFRNDPSPALIGVAGIDGFERRKLLEFKAGGDWHPVPGFGVQQAVVWRNARGDRELWVCPFDKTNNPDNMYRHAWKAFAGGAAPPGTVIDHLYPETAAARFGMSHVRLLPIDAAANRRTTHIEKVLANWGTKKVKGSQERTEIPERVKRTKRREHTADFFAAVKVMGFLGHITQDRTVEKIASDFIRHALALGVHLPPEWSNPALVKLEIELTAESIRRYRTEWASQQEEV